MKALKYLLVKEYKQMFRNWLLPIIFVILPVMMMNFVPRIANQEVKNLNVAVIDNDHSTLSTRLINKISASTYFNLYATCQNYDEAFSLLQEGSIDFIVTIDNGFERYLYREGSADVMVTVNSVDGMKGGLGSGYLTQIISQYASQLNAETGQASIVPANMQPRYLFNPELKYEPYMIPALMSMTLILLVGFLPALNVVGEKERGTIEQINVTPVGRIEFILSKMIPYWTVGLAIVGISMVLAWRIHGVAPAGSVLTVLVFNLVYILTISSLGLTVSNYSDNMRQAAMVMFFFVVIFMLTSGLISPLASMPDWAQAATRLNPIRYINTAMRDIYLKGSDLSQLMSQFVPLCVYGVAASVWAIISYQKHQ